LRKNIIQNVTVRFAIVSLDTHMLVAYVQLFMCACHSHTYSCFWYLF